MLPSRPASVALYGAAVVPALRETYAKRPRNARPVHILHISDEGISTLFDKDELGNSGWDIADNTLTQAGGGGTMVLNLAENWASTTGKTQTA